MNQRETIDRSHALLKWAVGLVLIIIGIDKVAGLNLITYWPHYVGPLAASIIAPGTLVLLLGIVEIIVGIMMLTRWTRIAAYLSIAAFVLIIINLFTLTLYDIAARDALLALSLLVLVWLDEARAQNS